LSQFILLLLANSSSSSKAGISSESVSATLAQAIRALRPPRSHKMVFVANMGLKMGTGKLAAQVGHATLGVYRTAQRTDEGQAALEAWRSHGEVKIVVKGQTTEQLIDLFKQAKDANLHAYLVQDAGYTQIPPGSRTVLGIFGPVEDVDVVTGALKLL
jgi:PTH2 family peptidyl-tRNA hydrolase